MLNFSKKIYFFLHEDLKTPLFMSGCCLDIFIFAFFVPTNLILLGLIG